MKIEHSFYYNASCEELADEFCEHDSGYQTDVINNIGLQFNIWSKDKRCTGTYVQLMEIAEQLNDNGKWFVKTLYEYMTEAKNG